MLETSLCFFLNRLCNTLRFGLPAAELNKSPKKAAWLIVGAKPSRRYYNCNCKRSLLATYQGLHLLPNKILWLVTYIKIFICYLSRSSLVTYIKIFICYLSRSSLVTYIKTFIGYWLSRISFVTYQASNRVQNPFAILKHFTTSFLRHIYQNYLNVSHWPIGSFR